MPQIKVPEAVLDKFKNLVATQGALIALQSICPIELDLKILARQCYKNKTHDITILFYLKDTSALLDPADIQAFISQLLAERKSSAVVTIDRVKYEGKIYTAVFIDR